MPEDQPPQGTDPDASQDSLEKQLNSKNLAEDMSDEQLEELGRQCKEGFDKDLASRGDWERDLDEWTKLAMQTREMKSYPWKQASNVKYPLLSTAAMQFAARAYPSLVPSDGKIVKARIIGKDPNGAKTDKSDRIATYMSWQIMYEMPDWEEDMDRLLMMLPIIGTMFKKTYWCPVEQEVVSCLVLPKNLVVNNWATTLDSSERVSEIIEMSPRILEERKRQEIFLDVDLGEPPMPMTEDSGNPSDETTPYTLIEQHTFYDRDDDGYDEPCVVTFHKESGKVLRVLPRYELDNVEMKDDKVIKIKPTQFYTKYSFIPNPNGSFYAIGFGVLLGPLNEAINSLINQLIDSGSLNNLQAGFIGKGLRIKMGETPFNPGEWKTVNAMAEDLRKQIMPLPTKEPSNVLFQLMGSLVTSGKELASVAEIFTGKMPGQNTPATTTMASIEQGMKVFTAVYKRIYRSLESEFKKIYKLNHVYINPETYGAVLDTPIGPDDFDDENYDVCPGADPTAVSQTEKLLKAQGLLELLPTGMLNPVEVLSRVFQAQEQPNWERLFSQEIQQSGQVQPQPDPKMMEMQMKMQLEQQKAQMQGAQIKQKMELEDRSAQTQLAMKQQEHTLDMQNALQKNAVEAAIGEHKQKIFMAQGAQQLQQSDEVHQQKLAQQKEAIKSSPTTNSKTGSGKK